MMVSDLYARKSNEDAGKSVARQERAWRTDCVREGVEPGRVFVDPNFSASRYATKARPDFEALIEHIRADNAQMISLWESSRGSREMLEWITFLNLCRDKGVLIRVFGDDDPVTYDPRRQRDRDLLIREGMAAEAEIERLRSRSKAGTADAAQQGRPQGPMVDGYKRVYGAPTADSVSEKGNKRRHIEQVIDEDRAWIYRAAAEGVLNGLPGNYLARILNAFEVPTASGGKRWTSAGLLKRLLLPAMEGHRVHQGVVVARNAWPAILDPDTARRLRQLVAAPRASRTHADTRLRHPLSGVVQCGLCGRPLQGRVGIRGTALYECTPNRNGCGRVSVASVRLESVVNAMVVGRLRQPDAAAAFVPSTDSAELAAVERELQSLLDRQRELYVSAAQPGGPSMALVAAAERELVPRIVEVRARVDVLRMPPVLRGYDPAHLAAHWLGYPVGERRAIVLALADVVLAPAGERRYWSVWRLGGSRWRGDLRSWGDLWRENGLPVLGC